MHPTTDGTPSNPLQAQSQALADIVEHLGTATVAVLGRRQAIASGTLWRDGLVVTAAHVLRRTPAAVTLVADGGARLGATLVGIDTPTDVALFRLADGAAAAQLAPPAFGDAAALRAGHFALAVGRSEEGDLLASHGIVNRVGGAWQTWLGGHVDRLIRLDGGVYEGLSGGPVADAGGRVVGIASAALSRSYGVVVPASTVSRVVDALLANGHVARPWLGIGAQPVPLPADAATNGLLITALAAGGPAQKAGMLIGDIVARAAGQPAHDLRALRSALAPHVGAAVQVEVLRGGVATHLEVTVAEWPQERRSCR